MNSLQRISLRWVALGVGLLWWGAAALRHHWLQSNGFDLGIYDQVAWQIGQGLEARSSLLGLHHMGNHGAWVFYLIGLPYHWLPSVQWLFASQAFALAFTALPITALWRQRGLPDRLSLTAALLWWLQPQVFNTNLFDFHPETWAMPALAGAIWGSRARRPLLWLTCLIFLLGCRDGLSLVVMGLGLSEFAQKRWRWGATALVLGFGWLLWLSQSLYPTLNGNGAGPAALKRFNHLGTSVPEILLNGVTQPWSLIHSLPWAELPTFLLLLAAPTLLFWRKRSVPILLASLPLLAVNLLSADPAQRNLVHHYNLPMAVIFATAAIDGLSSTDLRHWPWRRLIVTAACWALLAKPGYFLSIYTSRLDQIADVQIATQLVQPEDRLLTSSHYAPHFSERKSIELLRRSSQINAGVQNWDAILLNPSDPGWSSRSSLQRDALKQARQEKWICKKWQSGINLCLKRQNHAKNVSQPGLR